MLATGEHTHWFNDLTEKYTVVTKSDLPSWESSEAPREVKAAIDQIIALSARQFVGNSVSSFSAYTIMRRERDKLPAWHYNGGKIPLQEVLTPMKRGGVSTFARPIKWVFTVHIGKSALSTSFANQVKVAVMSARARTTLVPICITTAHANSEFSQWLVSHRVRVISHTPRWADRMRDKVAHINRQKKLAREGHFNDSSHLFGDADAMIGTFMRIDIPILGFRDEFILYTDVDVMFKTDIDWTALLGNTGEATIRSTNDFAEGKFNFSPAGKRGLPRYFSGSGETTHTKDPLFMNAGVMLMNMRSLRETYEKFLEFIFADDDLNWITGPGDQGAYKYFYSDNIPNELNPAKPHSNFLPYALNWKAYWKYNREAAIIHFHGPKCDTDYEPFIDRGYVAVKVFEHLLKHGATQGDARRLCREYRTYLSLENASKWQHIGSRIMNYWL